MTLVLLLVAVTLLLVAFAFLGPGKYRRLYAPAHLAEIADKLAALAEAPPPEVNPSASPPGADAVPHFITSAGLVVLWSRAHAGETTTHHLSLSHQHDFLALGARLSLMAYVLTLLDADLRAVTLESSALVLHAHYGRAPTPEAPRPPRLDPTAAREHFRRALERRAELPAPVSAAA